jgi:hypothetical protein
MSYADPSDIAIELGRSTYSDDDSAQWQAWLDRVERAIERGFRRAGLVLADQIALGDPTESDVIDVEVARVADRVNNPTKITSITRSVDDASVTTRNDNAGDGDPLDLTDLDWQALLPGRDSAAFSTRPGFDADVYSPHPQPVFNAIDPFACP